MRTFGAKSLFVVAALMACENHDDGDISRSQLAVAQARAALASAWAEDDLITSILTDEENHTIHFEISEPIVIANRDLHEMLYDSAHWLVTFRFHDGTEQMTSFVGELRVDQGDITVNPYLTSPLSALAKITTPVRGRFKVIVKGKPEKGITIEKEFNRIQERHELPILGLYEDHLNEVEFIFMGASGNVRTSALVKIPVAPIEDKPPLEIETLKNSLPMGYDGLYVISNLRIGFDQTGEVRWYYNPQGAYFGKLRNGNFLLADASNVRFFEITMLGQIVREYKVPGGLHHEIYEMHNGNFLVGSYSPPGRPFEDRLVEVSRTSGTVVREWDLKAILDPSRESLPDAATGDWLHINSAYYDARDSSIVISGRSQCVVAKFDYATGAVRWILSNHNGWDEGFEPYLLTPIDAHGNPADISNIDFWPYGQHSIHLLPDRKLLLYDNGDYRGFYDDPDVPLDSYSRICEYNIDEENMTVQLLWQFTNDKTVFTRFTGSSQFLDETRLVGYMSISENTPRITEVSMQHEVLFEATINRGKASYYRTQKVDVYSGIDE